MLSYQHHYHAGNHADILKHWLLYECITYMQSKDKGFDYIDAHAGAGIYSLKSNMALKTSEAAQGVDRLMLNERGATLLPGFSSLLNPYWQTKRYPGSPEIMRKLMRAQDRSWLFELHPQTFRELERNIQHKKIFIRQQNGLEQLGGLLPTPTRRALIIIDPSYEVKSEYNQVAEVAEIAWNKMPQAVILIWYPLLASNGAMALINKLKKTAIKNVLQVEMSVSEAAEGMTGSGMLVVNPPWTLKALVENALQQLSGILAEDNLPRCKCVQLTPQ